MNKLEIISDFFERIKNDPVIDPVHISLYLAIFQLLKPEESDFVFIERRATMYLSKIASPATYFRKLNELNERGLIEYYPSRKKCRLTRVSLRKEEKDGKRKVSNNSGPN
ncbi:MULTISPECIES: hypothetical protein [Sphingobacterium]|uniref:hypothetical protein n=1 Tax=Sphingobacterium TaxID=28453 RepID=UPI0028AE80DF|nr:hypothetical protein [Sphingobacterium multivorum]